MDNKADDRKAAVVPASGDKPQEDASLESRSIANPVKTGDDEGPHPAGLSPPDTSSMSSVNPDMLGDEIIVGTHGDEETQSPLPVVSDAEDVDDATVGKDKEVQPHNAKRKRSSTHRDLSQDKMESSPVDEEKEIDTPRGSQGKSSSANSRDVKNVLLGYWRDSGVQHDGGKHAVVGFMDVRDRLRTRVQPVTRSGDLIDLRMYPIPPGPGGSWVTFDKIAFNNHLVGMDHNQIKEYVKIRGELTGYDGSQQKIEEADHIAAREARRRVERNPPADAAQAQPIAYGRDLPDNAQVGKHDSKRRRLVSSASAGPEREHPGYAATGQMQALDGSSAPLRPMGATRPYGGLENRHSSKTTRVVVGTWKHSKVKDPKDKHAVQGIVGVNHGFRLKLTHYTLDGRHVEANFPTGPGRLWLHYDEADFLPHLSLLSRPQMKQYCRIRQRQIDAGETEADRIGNETQAVHEAQLSAKEDDAAEQPPVPMAHEPMLVERHEAQTQHNGLHYAGGHELRQHRPMPRNEPHAPRHSLPEPEIRHLATSQNIDPVDRVQGLATREVSRMEAMQMRHDRHHQNRNPMGAPAPMDPIDHHRHQFQENRDRMQRIWSAQEANRIRAGAEEAKIHEGIKYERKLNGPFSGKLVSKGAIITIDGEDYVEYRVLTKPSFF